MATESLFCAIIYFNSDDVVILLINGCLLDIFARNCLHKMSVSANDLQLRQRIAEIASEGINEGNVAEFQSHLVQVLEDFRKSKGALYNRKFRRLFQATALVVFSHLRDPNKSIRVF